MNEQPLSQDEIEAMRRQIHRGDAIPRLLETLDAKDAEIERLRSLLSCSVCAEELVGDSDRDAIRCARCLERQEIDAVAAERERCAAICDGVMADYKPDDNLALVARLCATLIRSTK